MDLPKLLAMSSPIYRLELVMVGRLFAQDPQLYADIIFSNTDNVAMMERFIDRFRDMLDDIKINNKQEFELKKLLTPNTIADIGHESDFVESYFGYGLCVYNKVNSRLWKMFIFVSRPT